MNKGIYGHLCCCFGPVRLREPSADHHPVLLKKMDVLPPLLRPAKFYRETLGRGQRSGLTGQYGCEVRPDLVDTHAVRVRQSWLRSNVLADDAPVLNTGRRWKNGNAARPRRFESQSPNAGRAEGLQTCPVKSLTMGVLGWGDRGQGLTQNGRSTVFRPLMNRLPAEQLTRGFLVRPIMSA